MPPIPAHNDISEYPIPYKQIQAQKCINCGRPRGFEEEHITYTRLHNKKILWWHRRAHYDEVDPCSIKPQKNQLCGTCGKPVEKKRTAKTNYPYICVSCRKKKEKKRAYEHMQKMQQTPREDTSAQ